MRKVTKYVKKVLPKNWGKILADPRGHGVCRSLDSIVSSVMDGLVCGCENLRALEELTELRGERIPDTTIWDVLVKLEAEPLKAELARGVKAASRGHELDDREAFPLEMVVVDGKKLMTTQYEVNEFSAARGNQHDCPPRHIHQALRAFYVSSELKLHLGQMMVPGNTNEMATLAGFLSELKALYGRTKFLGVLSFDFGFMSAENAQAVINMGSHYIFSLKDPNSRKETTAKAMALLGDRDSPELSMEEYVNGKYIVRNLYRCDACNVTGWEHAREFWRVEKITTDNSGKVTTENFYKISSIPKSKLTHKQVLLAVRLHWNIENNANWVLDTVWKEDSKPWCAAAVELISMLRLIAYNAIARFKFRKIKPKHNEVISWRKVLTIVQSALFPIRQDYAFA